MAKPKKKPTPKKQAERDLVAKEMFNAKAAQPLAPQAAAATTGISEYAYRSAMNAQRQAENERDGLLRLIAIAERWSSLKRVGE